MKTSEKLRLLADAVERTPDHEPLLVRSVPPPEMAFHMNHYGIRLFDNSAEGFDVCGTACCALGIGAMAVPEFQEMGLKMHWSGPNKEYGTVRFEHKNEIAEDMDAGEIFFRITEQEANRLFSPGTYQGNDRDGRFWIRKEAVVARIREMADKYASIESGNY